MNTPPRPLTFTKRGDSFLFLVVISSVRTLYIFTIRKAETPHPGRPGVVETLVRLILLAVCVNGLISFSQSSKASGLRRNGAGLKIYQPNNAPFGTGWAAGSTTPGRGDLFHVRCTACILLSANQFSVLEGYLGKTSSTKKTTRHVPPPPCRFESNLYPNHLKNNNFGCILSQRLALSSPAKMLHLWLQYAATAFPWSLSRQQQKLDSILPLTQPPSISSDLDELPGGSPLSLCSVSRPTDLFQISSVELTKQPLYLYVYPANRHHKPECSS